MFRDPEVPLQEVNTQFPLIEIKVEPKDKTDTGFLVSALVLLVRGDRNAFCRFEEQSNEVFIGGVSELHLDGIVGALISQGVAINIGAPQVAYRETITRAVQVEYTHTKRTGDMRQFARVSLKIEPNERGAGYAFESRVADGAVPGEYLLGIEKGLNSVMGTGIVAGFPIVDIKISLTGATCHEAASSAIAFEMASRMALFDGLRDADSILIEPVMKVEVTSPEEYIGGIIGDLNSRRGQITGTSSHDGLQILNAVVPLTSMFGYGSQLSSMSKSRATFTMAYSHYEAVPRTIMPDPDTFPPAIGMRA
jgi:elongation factor G